MERFSFWEGIRKLPWNFMDQMKQFLYCKAQRLLTASLKLIDICYDIQLLLQYNYPGKEMPFISPFNTTNSGSFIFCLMLHYTKSELDTPLYATRYAEKGIYDGIVKNLKY